jgi:hypothetical protein
MCYRCVGDSSSFCLGWLLECCQLDKAFNLLPGAVVLGVKYGILELLLMHHLCLQQAWVRSLIARVMR